MKMIGENKQPIGFNYESFLLILNSSRVKFSGR